MGKSTEVSALEQLKSNFMSLHTPTYIGLMKVHVFIYQSFKIIFFFSKLLLPFENIKFTGL